VTGRGTAAGPPFDFNKINPQGTGNSDTGRMLVTGG